MLHGFPEFLPKKFQHPVQRPDQRVSENFIQILGPAGDSSDILG